MTIDGTRWWVFRALVELGMILLSLGALWFDKPHQFGIKKDLYRKVSLRLLQIFAVVIRLLLFTFSNSFRTFDRVGFPPGWLRNARRVWFCVFWEWLCLLLLGTGIRARSLSS